MIRPELEYLNGKWEVVQEISTTYLNFPVTVPVGFKSDLASIPRVFWSIYPPFGKYNGAVIIHDYLYTTKILPRNLSDDILFEQMKSDGVDTFTCVLFYITVRIFGGKRYHKI